MTHTNESRASSCMLKLAVPVSPGSEAWLLSAAMHTVPPAPSMKAAREEAEMVLYECVKEALSRSRLKPRQVSKCSDILHLIWIFVWQNCTSFQAFLQW